MNFLDELYLEKIMPGASTGTKWLKNNRKKKIAVTSPVDGETFAHGENDHPLLITGFSLAFISTG